MNTPVYQRASDSERIAAHPAPIPTITVGVDGTPGDRYALTWAARAARAHRLAIRIVHVHPHQFDLSVTDRVHAAEQMAREIAPDLIVRVLATTGEIVETLVEQSTTARMLVLGPHPGRPLEGFSQSITTTVAAAARCPVVTVPRIPGRLPAGGGPVVVGVDGSPVSEGALAFAFEQASALGAELVAVHAWQDSATDPAGPEHVCGLGCEAIADTEERVLAESLSGWQQCYPDVRITRVVVHTRATLALLLQADTAQLLVVGSSGRAGLSGLLHGSTSQSLLYQSPVPVAIVRAPFDLDR